MWSDSVDWKHIQATTLASEGKGLLKGSFVFVCVRVSECFVCLSQRAVDHAELIAKTQTTQNKPSHEQNGGRLTKRDIKEEGKKS